MPFIYAYLKYPPYKLIMIACHPDRVFNCNEYMCDLLPDRYKQECEKWNKLTYNS